MKKQSLLKYLMLFVLALGVLGNVCRLRPQSASASQLTYDIRTLKGKIAALNGTAGRAQKLVNVLQTDDLAAAGKEFYNSLEAPALEKYPLLALFQEFLRANGAAAALMSGSGSTTFALSQTLKAAEELQEKFKAKFGETNWTAVVPV